MVFFRAIRDLVNWYRHNEDAKEFTTYIAFVVIFSVSECPRRLPSGVVAVPNRTHIYFSHVPKTRSHPSRMRTTTPVVAECMFFFFFFGNRPPPHTLRQLCAVLTTFASNFRLPPHLPPPQLLSPAHPVTSSIILTDMREVRTRNPLG